MRLDKEVHDKNVKEEIKKRIAGKVDVQLGKKGLTREFLDEIRKRLEKHGVVKIKILRSFRKTLPTDRRELAKMIAKEVGAKLLEIRGYTFILVKSKIKEHR